VRAWARSDRVTQQALCSGGDAGDADDSDYGNHDHYGDYDTADVDAFANDDDDES
jgi:hypothetical protein